MLNQLNYEPLILNLNSTYYVGIPACINTFIILTTNLSLIFNVIRKICTPLSINNVRKVLI